MRSFVVSGAEYKPRGRATCAGCGRRRLCTATRLGPACNDCLCRDDTCGGGVSDARNSCPCQLPARHPGRHAHISNGWLLTWL